MNLILPSKIQQNQCKSFTKTIKPWNLLLVLAAITGCRTPNGTGTNSVAGVQKLRILQGNEQVARPGSLLPYDFQIEALGPNDERIRTPVSIQWSIEEGDGHLITYAKTTEGGLAHAQLELGATSTSTKGRHIVKVSIPGSTPEVSALFEARASLCDQENIDRLPFALRDSNTNGTAGHEFIVCSPAQWNQIAQNTQHLQSHYILESNLDFTDLSIIPIGSPEEPFRGSILGQGYAIQNAKISMQQDGVGIIRAAQDAKISQLEVSDSVIHAEGSVSVGALIGLTNNSTIHECKSTRNTVVGKMYVGGLIGRSDYGLIERSSNSSSVSGTNIIGGLIGFNSTNINNSSSIGDVVGDDEVGGMLGYNEGAISKSYSHARVQSNLGAGGFVGTANGTYHDCMAQGRVEGPNVAGFAGGTFPWVTMTRVFALNHVIGSSVSAGLTINLPAAFLESYWDIDTTGQRNAVGDAPGSVIAGGQGHPSSYFLNPRNFALDPKVWKHTHGSIPVLLD